MIYLNLVREYFDLEFSNIKDKIKNYDLNRVIDDFILLCFFIGNDFLPRVYCFDIKKGNLDKLVEMFKNNLIENGVYINDNGLINWKGLEILLSKL